MGLMFKDEDLPDSSPTTKFMINLLALLIYLLSIGIAIYLFKWIADGKVPVKKKLIVFIIVIIFCAIVDGIKNGS